MIVEQTDSLVTLPGLTRALRLPTQWLKREADSGNIPCLRIGRKRLFNVDAVRRVLAQRAAREGLRAEGAANGGQT